MLCQTNTAAQPTWAPRFWTPPGPTPERRRTFGALGWCCTPSWWGDTPSMTQTPARFSPKSAVDSSASPTTFPPKPGASFAASCDGSLLRDSPLLRSYSTPGLSRSWNLGTSTQKWELQTRLFQSTRRAAMWVPSSANPRNLRNLIILTHGISTSQDGQAFQRGANQICDGIKIVAAQLDMEPLWLCWATVLSWVVYMHSDWLPFKSSFPS